MLSFGVHRSFGKVVFNVQEFQKCSFGSSGAERRSSKEVVFGVFKCNVHQIAPLLSLELLVGTTSFLAIGNV